MIQKKSIMFLLGIVLIFSSISSVSAADSSGSFNLLRNAGFANAKSGEAPDYWSGFDWWRPDWPDCWKLSEEGYIPGTRSMKLTNKFSNPVYLESNRYLSLPDDKIITFSAYLKSSQPKTKVEFHVGPYTFRIHPIRGEVTVGTEWERYWITGKTQKDPDGQPGVLARIVLLDNATLLVNAPQLEEGETPGVWTLSGKDKAVRSKDSSTETVPAESKYAVPEIQCSYVNKPPVIDGLLNDEAWKKAGKTVVFNQLDEAKPADYPTEAFICKDKDNLYVAFRCHEIEMGKLVSKMNGRDSSLIFSDDEVEFFISPRADGAGYLQFAVNVMGTQWDAKGSNPGMLWNTVWECRTGRGTDAWTVEMKIPFKSLQFSSDTKKDWLVNFARYRARPKTEEYSAWAPVVSTFHDTKHYGRLKNISQEDVALAAQAQIESGWVTYLDKSFYTDESKADIFINAPKGTKVKITLNNRTEEGLLTESHLFQVDISTLPLGSYLLKVKAGEREVTITLKKLSTKPNQVKIDRVRQMLLVDGKPFVPIATTLGYENHERNLKDQKAHGFNAAITTLHGGGYTDAQFREVLDAAQAVGMKIIFWFWGSDKTNHQKWQDELLHLVGQFKEHPALLAWDVLDEVDDNPEWLTGLLSAAKAVDPYHPAFISHRPGWNDEKDKFSGDFNCAYSYPICAYDISAYEATHEIGKDIKAMAVDARKTGKVVFYWNGIYGWGDAVREPTPSENSVVSYISLIDGCRLLGYYMYRPMSVPLWESFIELSKEVQTLTPVFYYGQEITEDVSCSNPAIDFAAFTAKGKTYIVAINTKEREAQTEFLLPGSSGNVEVLFENRKLKTLKEKLKDTFKPLERHVYLIDAGGS